MLIELAFGLPPAERDAFIASFHEHLIRGISASGESLEFKESVELAGWAPPENWEDLALSTGLTGAPDSGISIMTHNFATRPGAPAEPVVARIESFIRQTREKHPFKIQTQVPFAVVALGCIKNRTPLPSEYWRQFIFPQAGPAPTSRLPAGKRASRRRSRKD